MRFKSPLSKSFAAASLGAVLAAGLGWSLLTYAPGRLLIRKSYELLLVARGEVSTEEAVIVYLDEISYRNLKQPLNAPLDRGLHAQLIDRLTAAGAKAIVFDIVFTDPNTNNPGADEQLARAIKASGRVVLAADNLRTDRKKKQFFLPFDSLRDAAAAIGSTEVLPDRDLVVRMHTDTPDDLIPSLSWAAAELVGAKVTKEESQRGMKRWMNYYGPPNFLPSVSYYEALEPTRLTPGFFRDKVVFIGSRITTRLADERKDEYINPFGAFSSEAMAEKSEAKFIPGVEIQATAFLNLLRGDWFGRLPPSQELSLILCLGIISGFGLVRFRPFIATLLAIAGLVMVTVISNILFRRTLIWFPWLILIVQIGAAFSWSIIFNSIQLYIEKRLYEHTLGIYLSPKLVKKFSRDRNFLRPHAEEQTITILFTDIEDFTVLSQGISSDALAQLMNQYFHMAVSDCIHKTDGTVVKYIGDAVFAFWNAPEAQPDHELRACEAALLFRRAGAKPINGVLLHTRLGIHTGSARVGNFGSPERVDYTALGESVNLASRLEGLNKFLGTECVISGATKRGIGERLITRLLGQFQLKGFEKPVVVHEVVGWPEEAEESRAWREAFGEALSNYERRNLEFAEIGFRRTLELKAGDGPSNFYLAKMEELRAQPPAQEWATHTVLKEK